MNETLLYSLLQGIQRTDPRIHDLLKQLITEIQVINAEVFPPETIVDSEQGDTETTVADLLSFTYTLILDGIKFEWTRPDGVSFFEIRYGADWDTGSRVLVTSTLSAVLEGKAPGSHFYHIKGIDSNGLYSLNPLSLEVVIPELGNITVSGQVIDNSILLTWQAPTSSFRIDYYIIRRDAAEVGRQSGTFAAFSEITGGTYDYSVQAVDIYGNTSLEATVELVVAQPPDYILEDIATSILDGTRTNVALESGTPSLIANVDDTVTWENHFLNNGWNTIQDQINAGFPYYLQPTLTTGEYEEVFDYGAVFDNVIANVDWNFNQIVPTMQVVSYLSTSLDDITYTAETSGKQIFASSLRYVKVRIVFTALN